MNPLHNDTSFDPPARYLEVLHEIAQHMRIDVQKLIAGQPIEYKGFTFWLTHYGAQDPTGMTVMLNMGALPAEEHGDTIYRRLLEQNAMTPAMLNGYFSVLPGADVVAYCFRIDLEEVPNAAEALFGFIGVLSADLERLGRILEAEHALRQPAAGFAGAMAPMGQ